MLARGSQTWELPRKSVRAAIREEIAEYQTWEPSAVRRAKGRAIRRSWRIETCRMFGPSRLLLRLSANRL